MISTVNLAKAHKSRFSFHIRSASLTLSSLCGACAKFVVFEKFIFCTVAGCKRASKKFDSLVHKSFRKGRQCSRARHCLLMLLLCTAQSLEISSPGTSRGKNNLVCACALCEGHTDSAIA